MRDGIIFTFPGSRPALEGILGILSVNGPGSGLAPPGRSGYLRRVFRLGDKGLIGRLNHVAIAVPDLAVASARYRDVLGGTVSPVQRLPEHGVSVVFVELDNTKIELLEPLGADSPIAGFLRKSPTGGIHHLCYEVADIVAARDRLSATGARVLGDGTPRIGAHGKPVLFLHPKDFDGTLIELEEV